MRKASRQTSRQASRKSSRQASTRKGFSQSQALHLGLRDEKITNTQLSAERIEAISGRTWTLLSPLTGHLHWDSLGRGARGNNSGVGVSTFLND